MARVTAICLLLGIASALGVVTTQHDSRRLVTEIEREQVRTKALQVEWDQLDIEQKTIAALPTVQKFAKSVLRMSPPDRTSQVTLDLAGKMQP